MHAKLPHQEQNSPDVDRQNQYTPPCSLYGRYYDNASYIGHNAVEYWFCTRCRPCSICKVGWKDNLLLCDGCNKAYHTSCIGIDAVPEEKNWYCVECPVDGLPIEHRSATASSTFTFTDTNVLPFVSESPLPHCDSNGWQQSTVLEVEL